jgi:hypothetical protein
LLDSSVLPSTAVTFAPFSWKYLATYSPMPFLFLPAPTIATFMQDINNPLYVYPIISNPYAKFTFMLNLNLNLNLDILY